MSDLIAIDVAILPPADIVSKAIGLSAALPAEGSQGLRLDSAHLPHVTIAQLFVRNAELEAVYARLDGLLEKMDPFPLRITGAGHSGRTVWMAIERAGALLDLHHQVMESLRSFERPRGSAAAFVDGDARPTDIDWVASFRAKASFDAYRPHITLGHAKHEPAVATMAFTADTIAVCQLDRYCTCRHALRQWKLSAAHVS